MMDAIALDAMGSDNAPSSEVAGAVDAVRKSAVNIILVGDKEVLAAELRALNSQESDRLRIHHASEVVTMDDHPGKVFRKKTDSSMRVAHDLVVSGEAAGLVSAGNSGAVLGHSLFLLKRIPLVERPGIVQIFPTPTGVLTMCDLGANISVTPIMMAQFGVLAAHYDRILNGTTRPRVGILSNGTESSKGTEITRAASEILHQAAAHPEAQFEYIGYVEGTGLFDGHVDVVATDGFTGNVVLKTVEGVSQALMQMMRTAMLSSTRGKLGGLLAKPALQKFKHSIHYSEFGGAMLLGINGTATICHGRSDARAICNAILATQNFLDKQLQAQLGTGIERHKELWKS